MSTHSVDHHAADGADHGSYRSYITGFVLAVILTVIPFAAVMGGWFESRLLAVIMLAGFAVVQILVHMIYFLHMNGRSEEGWTLLAALFTLVIIGITVAGSLWVMWNMNANMMPHHGGI